VLQNPNCRPFESLVKLLAYPAMDISIRPQLMRFSSIFFGMMLAISAMGFCSWESVFYMMRRLKRGVMKDVVTVLAMVLPGDRVWFHLWRGFLAH